MKKFTFLLLAGILFPFCSEAQLAKTMAKYHEQPCVTVTQLDKSLYGLYTKNNLPPEAEEMLQNLDEVNFLNLNLNTCTPEIENKVTKQFREILDNSDKYKLAKSHNDELGKQLLYTRTKDGQVKDLVVWSQSPTRLDIIELRGNIQIDKVAMLSKALNIKGLSSLAVLSPDNNSYNHFKRSYDYSGDFNNEMEQMSRDLQKMAEEVERNFAGADFGRFMNDMFGTLGESFDKMGNMFEQYGDAVNIMSNSVQVTEQNGKTKIKIDSKNMDMIYVIDGKEHSKNETQIPENIRNIDVIPSRKNVKKSYLFITSQNKIGEFISYKNGVLIFKHDNQEYKYNLGKAPEALLIVDGELCKDFSVDPSVILQIRPLGKAEKEVTKFPAAEVLIITK